MRQGFDAIILGLNPTGLGVLQALGERGLSLAAVDKNRLEIGCFSRFGKKFIIGNRDLLRWLLETGESSRRIPVFPSSDEYLLFLSRNEQSLGEYYTFPFPRNELVERLLNKYEFYLLASQYTDQLPRSRLLGDECLRDWERWPCIVKPTYIHEFRRHFHEEKAWVVRNESELEQKRKILAEKGIKAIVQEIVEGPDHEQYSVCVYMDLNGRVREVLTTRKVRQSPPGFGVGTYVEIVNEQDLAASAMELLAKIGYSGIAEIEYRRDISDGNLKLIEINTRVWTQNKLASYGGKDIISACYSDHSGRSLAPLNGQARKWFFTMRDLLVARKYIKRGEVDLNGIVRSYLGEQGKVDAIWNGRDPFISLGLVPYIMWKLAAR